MDANMYMYKRENDRVFNTECQFEREIIFSRNFIKSQN